MRSEVLDVDAAQRIVQRSEHLAYENRFVSVYFDPVTFPNGVEGNYTRIVVGSHGGVAVLPVCDGSVGLVRQYRYPVGRGMWEAPRGFAEDEDPAANAARELREETGLVAREVIGLGVLHPDSGLMATGVDLFLAEVDDPTGFGAFDEVDDAVWLPIGEVLEMVATGDITDSFTVALVARAHLRGLI